jgi:hypothetical protein
MVAKKNMVQTDILFIIVIIIIIIIIIITHMEQTQVNTNILIGWQLEKHVWEHFSSKFSNTTFKFVVITNIIHMSLFITCVCFHFIHILNR